MTIDFLPMSTYAQPNPLEVNREFGDSESHDAYGKKSSNIDYNQSSLSNKS
jgi:hypothetical protein